MAGTGARRGVAEMRGRLQVLLCVLFFWLCEAVSGQIQYSIVEEMKQGSIVGNIATDLGLNMRRLSDRKLRVLSGSKRQHFELNADTGDLRVNDRIDREELCGADSNCLIDFQAVVENPLNVYQVHVTIQDINDNAPRFMVKNIDFSIAETALPGAHFSLGNAQDADIGTNSLQLYKLDSNAYFALEEKESSDGDKYAELVLENPLDREKLSKHQLFLTAFDGGDPIRSSTVEININVVDANDNFPVFSQESYRVSISEGAPNNTVVLQVKATDIDEGSNAKITYSFRSIPDNALHMFSLDKDTGDIRVRGTLDFEETTFYKLVLEAKDGGDLASHCRVLIEVLDENDNNPEITLTSVTSPVPENSVPGTVVALISVHDRDSGKNGDFTCHIQETVPFQLILSTGNIYKLVTAMRLDREDVPEYNITITATDKGTPPLTRSNTIRLQLSDINDNSPAFEKTSYMVYVLENNHVGASIFRLRASDLDVGSNARITYSILNNNILNSSMLSYTSINSQTGVIYAQRSYDYEQLKDFNLQVKAQDSGSPPLSSNVTIKVFIVDRNDNPPEILYPALSHDGSIMFEMVPPSAAQGYLITKVVAVDADSGHNSWLSYHFQQVSESLLFKIGLHTGEIRTSRVFLEKDSANQKLVILVKDNGQPPLSATVTLSIVFAEYVQEILPETSSKSTDSNKPLDLKLYLVIALILVSFLFILSLMVVFFIKCRKTNQSAIFDPLNPIFPQLDPRSSYNYQNETLPLPYPYEMAVALDAGNNQFTVLKPGQEGPKDLLIVNDSGTGNATPSDQSGIDSQQQFRPTTSEAAYDGRQRYLSNVILHKAPSSSTPST